MSQLDSPRAYEIVKRSVDVIMALAGLVILWPLLLAIAVGVKASSAGPLFYRGVRAGRYGRPFRIFKFRSMVADAETRGGTTTGKDDPRITPVGRVLRKYKLDELPQLLNLLLGDMSLVGPRPEVFEYVNQYSAEERRILSVRPGITDLSCLEFADLQECVGADDPDRVYRERILPRKNQLRLKYVDERDLWMDLTIVAKTIWLVLRKPVRAWVKKGSGTVVRSTGHRPKVSRAVPATVPDPFLNPADCAGDPRERRAA